MTEASDVFSYGKILFDLLGYIQDADMPTALQTLLSKCLKNKPEERISLRSLMKELDELRYAQRADKLSNLPVKHDKGVARTFSTIKAGTRETFSVFEKRFTIKGVELIMVYVPEGEFMMGSEKGIGNERPVHHVKINQAFYMGKFPITADQYDAVMETGSFVPSGRDLPKVNVSWREAKEFCARLSILLNMKFRLPTESEWEYACRAGTNTPYWWGNDMENKHCWYRENRSALKYHPVNEAVDEHTNPFGLCDMLGNVAEYCEDNWEADYETPRTQAAYTEYSEFHVTQGGAYLSDADDCSSTHRSCLEGKNPRVGFRIAFSA